MEINSNLEINYIGWYAYEYCSAVATLPLVWLYPTYSPAIDMVFLGSSIPTLKLLEFLLLAFDR